MSKSDRLGFFVLAPGVEICSCKFFAEGKWPISSEKYVLFYTGRSFFNATLNVEQLIVTNIEMKTLYSL